MFFTFFSVVHNSNSFLFIVGGILLYVYSTLCLSNILLMKNWVVSSLGLLWVRLLWTFLCKSSKVIFGYISISLQKKYLGVELHDSLDYSTSPTFGDDNSKVCQITYLFCLFYYIFKPTWLWFLLTLFSFFLSEFFIVNIIFHLVLCL